MRLTGHSAFLAALSLASILCAATATAQNMLDPAPLGSPADARLRGSATQQPTGTRASAFTGQPAGRYAPLREGKKDTGCMITLEASRKAQLAPACRDQGLVVFDPVNWQMERGRLGLTARKGHKAWFDRQDDGTWLRDPKEGKTLILRVI